jgi:hypothetical protein
VGEHGALVAGIAFVEGVAATWGVQELRAWIQEHLISPGRMAQLVRVNEAVVGTIALDAEPTAATDARIDDLPKLLAMARSRVVVTLRAFLASPSDDRFVHSAIFNDRVQRIKVERGNVWVARPIEKDQLSDIVLSLFCVDILMHRDFHERNLCVCDVCGRISFTPDATSKHGCAEHVPRTETTSGIHRSAPVGGQGSPQT